MPTTSRREDDMLERFLSGYEDRSWAGAQIEWLDKSMDKAVEARATRKSDGKTLAIEHTIIEPFVGDNGDFATFKDFLQIEYDRSLRVPGRWIVVYIPVGALRGHNGNETEIVKGVHDWLLANRTALSERFSEHKLTIAIRGTPVLTMVLHTRVTPLPAGKGALNIRRQQTEENLGDVIERALRKKLPKLAGTVANKRILILERQHMNLHASRILQEIERYKTRFLGLANIDEIWIVETMFYERQSYLRFERFENGTLAESLDFLGDEFLGKGWSKPLHIFSEVSS